MVHQMLHTRVCYGTPNVTYQSVLWYTKSVVNSVNHKSNFRRTSRYSVFLTCFLFWRVPVWISAIIYLSRLQLFLSLGICCSMGWCSWLRLHYKQVRFPIVSLGVFIYLIIPVALWHWSRLCFQRKWVPATSLGGDKGRGLGMTTLLPSCSEILGASKSWIPKGLSRPV